MKNISSRSKEFVTLVPQEHTNFNEIDYELLIKYLTQYHTKNSLLLDQKTLIDHYANFLKECTIDPSLKKTLESIK